MSTRTRAPRNSFFCTRCNHRHYFGHVHQLVTEYRGSSYRGIQARSAWATPPQLRLIETMLTERPTVPFESRMRIRNRIAQHRAGTNLVAQGDVQPMITWLRNFAQVRVG